MAQGHRAFDQPALARAAISRAIDIAAQNQFGQLRYEAEQFLEQLESQDLREHRQTGALSLTSSWSPEVQGVAEALHELRVMAVAQG